MSKRANIAINVHDNVERALKQLKKKIEREGIVRDMKRIVYHEPPTQKRRKRLDACDQTKLDTLSISKAQLI